MYVKFNKVIIDNFLSFGHAEIALDGSGYTLITGENNNPDDNCSSNGSGKSTIWNAVCWALTGSTTSGISKNVVNLKSTIGCGVEVYFEYNKDSYRVCRYRDHEKYGSNLKIYINNEDKSGKGIRDSEKLLETYLPDLTYSLIGSVIILGQGLPQRFTNNTPAGRKEVLEKLSKSDYMIADIKDAITKRKNVLNSKLREIDDKVLVAETELKSFEKRLIDCNDKITNLPTVQEYDERINLLSKELLEREVSGKQIAEVLERAKTSKADLDVKYESLNNQIRYETEDVKAKFDASMSKLRSEISVLDGEKNALVREIAKLNAITDVCPTCGQKIQGVHKPDTTEQTARLAEISNKIDALNKELSEQSTQLTDALHAISNKYAEELEILKRSQSEFDLQVKTLEDDYTNAKSAYRDTKEMLALAEQDKQHYNDRVRELNDEKTGLIRSVDDNKKQIVLYNVEQEDFKNRIDVISKMLTLATRDFRGYLLTNVISFISNKAKEYCLSVFDNDKITFELDGNNILIAYCDKPYENLSGGEKQKIDIIVQLAIRDMLCKFSNFSCNCIVLDELFDALDAVSCQKVIDLISTKLLDVENVYIVTHRKDLSIPIDSTITVIKDRNGISSIAQ